MNFPTFAVLAVLCLCAISNEGAHGFAPSGGVAHRGLASSGVTGNARTTPSLERNSRTSLFMSSRGGGGRDFYRILGINRNADTKEIKSAFRKMARQYHPGELQFMF